MKKFLNIFLALLLCLAGCQSDNQTTEQSTKETREIHDYTYQNYGSDFFDTAIVYKDYAYEKEASEELYNSIEEQFAYYSDLFDKYNDYEGMNNIKTINDNAGIAPVEVDQPLIDLLLLSKEYYDLTDGAFDITMGSLLKVWHTYREAGIDENEKGNLAPIPTEAEIEEAAQYEGWEYIEIDDENNTVYITDSNVSLDVGGVAKGYAVSQVVTLIQENENTYCGLLNAGQSNIQLIGTKPDGTVWKVGIQNPDSTSESLMTMSIEGTASVVSSGDYLQYYIGEDNKRYHHIIDPSTHYPVEGVRECTVVLEDGGIGDILSTSLMIMGAEKGSEFLDEYCQTHGTVYAQWVYDIDSHPDMDGTTANNYYIIQYNAK